MQKIFLLSVVQYCDNNKWTNLLLFCNSIELSNHIKSNDICHDHFEILNIQYFFKIAHATLNESKEYPKKIKINPHPVPYSSCKKKKGTGIKMVIAQNSCINSDNFYSGQLETTSVLSLQRTIFQVL